MKMKVLYYLLQSILQEVHHASILFPNVRFRHSLDCHVSNTCLLLST